MSTGILAAAAELVATYKETVKAETTISTGIVP